MRPKHPPSKSHSSRNNAALADLATNILGPCLPDAHMLTVLLLTHAICRPQKHRLRCSWVTTEAIQQPFPPPAPSCSLLHTWSTTSRARDSCHLLRRQNQIYRQPCTSRISDRKSVPLHRTTPKNVLHQGNGVQGQVIRPLPRFCIVDAVIR